MKIILKNINILSPEDQIDETTNLIIVDGIIKKIGNVSKEDESSATVYNLENNYCVPGLYDMHVHLREPGREDAETIESGSMSAAAGGFTGVACMPNTEPCIDNAQVIRFIKEKSQNLLVDVNPIGAVSSGRQSENLAPLAEMYDAGAVGFSDDGTAVKTASLVKSALEYSSMLNTPIIEHCEDDSLADGGAMNEGEISTLLGLPPIPSIAEDLIIMRDILVSNYTGGKIHIAHISTKNGVQLVKDAKSKGFNVTAEVTPHHFTLSEEQLKSYSTNYKMNPPLRTKEDVLAMIEGLKDGTIDCIASDHAPHSIEDKEMEFVYAPNGILGLETQLGLSLTELYHKKHLTLKDLVYKLSINPRKILNIPIPKIAEGEKADLTIFDPEAVWTVDINKFKSKSRNSPFNNRLLKGKSTAVINNSQMYIDDQFIKI